MTPERIERGTRAMSVEEFYEKWKGRTNPAHPQDPCFLEWMEELYAVWKAGWFEVLDIAIAKSKRGESV